MVVPRLYRDCEPSQLDQVGLSGQAELAVLSRGALRQA